MRAKTWTKTGRLLRVVAVCAALGGCVRAAADTAKPVPTLVMPNIASTADATEVRVAFSPDGKRRLWGRIGKENPRGFEIVESVRTRSGWSVPRPVSFNSLENDFDPFFARDGRAVLFFSNRPGGFGGDDLWMVRFDPRKGSYGTPRNLGAPVNTAKDEWAPSLSGDGRTLLFSSNGHGGEGGQDLFVATRTASGWSAPRNLGRGVNGAADDFDATFVGDAMLIYTSGDAENGPIALYRARLSAGKFAGHERLPAPFNCSKDFNLGPAWTPREPHILYFSANCPGLGRGRSDIFSAQLP